jgi:hypothetical protein
MGILQKWVNRVTHFLPPGRQQRELSSLLCCCYQSNSQALLMPGSPQLAEWALTACKTLRFRAIVATVEAADENGLFTISGRRPGRD